jgi:hydroxyacylglutathione hydrolase
MSNFRVAIIPVTGFQQNCSLVYDEVSKVGAVVDPGGDLHLIREAITKMGLKIEKILLTHGHIDHAGGAAELKEFLNVPIEGPHIADKFLLEDLPATGANYGQLDARVCTPDRWLEDGDTVSVGEFVFTIITAPGHSPGSVVFYNAAAKFMLMGDVLFQGSIGRTDLRQSNHEHLMSSIKNKILPLGDDIVFLPGHGQASQLGEERRNNPFLR